VKQLLSLGLGSLMVTLMALGVTAGEAYAYSPSGAASWADAHVWDECAGDYIGSMSAYGYCYPNDCTSFVSKALHYGGGYPYHGDRYSPIHDDHYWWNAWIMSSWYNSDSWSLTSHLKTFLTWDYPGGYYYGTRLGTDTSAYDDIYNGDVLFFNWGTGEGWSHSRIQVATGTSYDGHYGDLADQHTPARYHSFWSGYYENIAHRTTTTICEMHVSSSN
jgi:hypothetical protein